MIYCIPYLVQMYDIYVENSEPRLLTADYTEPGWSTIGIIVCITLVYGKALARQLHNI